jgi:hypothetical protein
MRHLLVTTIALLTATAAHSDTPEQLAKRLANWSASEVFVTTGELPKDSSPELVELVKLITAALEE